MTDDTPRPWWSSVAEQPAHAGAEADSLDDVDPLEAFRSARRPRPVPPRAAGSGPDPDPSPPSSDQDAATARRDPEVAHRPELCGVCPLCTLARTLEDTRPELMEHLTEAARHLAAAARALLETPPGRPDTSAHHGSRGDSGPASPRHTAVQRIPLDGPPDPQPGHDPGGEG